MTNVTKASHWLARSVKARISASVSGGSVASDAGVARGLGHLERGLDDDSLGRRAHRDGPERVDGPARLLGVRRRDHRVQKFAQVAKRPAEVDGHGAEPRLHALLDAIPELPGEKCLLLLHVEQIRIDDVEAQEPAVEARPPEQLDEAAPDERREARLARDRYRGEPLPATSPAPDRPRPMTTGPRDRRSCTPPGWPQKTARWFGSL